MSVISCRRVNNVLAICSSSAHFCRAQGDQFPVRQNTPSEHPTREIKTRQDKEIRPDLIISLNISRTDRAEFEADSTNSCRTVVGQVC